MFILLVTDGTKEKTQMIVQEMNLGEHITIHLSITIAVDPHHHGSFMLYDFLKKK